MKTSPSWVSKDLFPFTSRWVKVDELEMHYIDEGKGDVILFAHGTPEWSFGYRDIILGLRSHYRCIAIDMLGFGLSDKAPGEDYSCRGHALRLEKIIQALGLQNITIMANDFGGGISLYYAIHHPENVRSVILFNTWLWSLKEDPHYSKPAKIMRGWLGKFLYRQLNFPVNTVMPAAFGDRKKLTKEIHAHYKSALPDAASRIGVYAISRELMDASPWWQDLNARLNVLHNKPFLFFWGLKDKFIPPYELDKWKALRADATVHVFEDAGHFVQEEKAAEMIPVIREFLG